MGNLRECFSFFVELFECANYVHAFFLSLYKCITRGGCPRYFSIARLIHGEKMLKTTLNA